MKKIMEGGIEKMLTELKDVVEYRLPLGDHRIYLNPLLGKKIQLQYKSLIECIYCHRAINKSFNQGYCYPCFQSLARCDTCIMSPEKCHYSSGTCREPDWAQSHCLVDHIVYLSNTSGPKVGITRSTQTPTRWIDQGATQALPLMSVKTRHQSGLLEQAFKAHVSDKTRWQQMLKGGAPAHDLLALRDSLMVNIRQELSVLADSFGADAFSFLPNASVIDIRYPVRHYPDTVKSLDFEKQTLIEGVLQGMKGQYLLLDTGVLNIRKFTGYHVSFSVT